MFLVIDHIKNVWNIAYRECTHILPLFLKHFSMELRSWDTVSHFLTNENDYWCMRQLIFAEWYLATFPYLLESIGIKMCSRIPFCLRDVKVLLAITWCLSAWPAKSTQAIIPPSANLQGKLKSDQIFKRNIVVVRLIKSINFPLSWSHCAEGYLRIITVQSHPISLCFLWKQGFRLASHQYYVRIIG